MNHLTNKPSLPWLILLLSALVFVSGPDSITGITASARTERIASVTGWDAVPGILARIKPPTFKTHDFQITDYGAVAGATADNTEAIRKAIDACNAAGGGRVIIPAGVFLTGAVHLKSNVNLYLSEGATLKFSTDPAKYPLVYTRFEGTECMNYSPLIYAFEQQNIAVTGKGTLDGSASDETWWAWARRPAGGGDAPARADIRQLLEMGQSNVPVEKRGFGPGHKLRPNFIQPYRSQNILIEGIKIINSPMWEIHPVLSSNITVRGVHITTHGPNNDGCDPEASRDVLIEDCIFDTGDDCIAIKSGRDNDGRRVNVPSENIIVRNCTMKDGHGGVVMGSEISGGCRNVFVENCHMDSPNLDRAIRFKSNARRGGFVENVYVRNIDIGRVSEAILTIDFMYETGPDGPYKPVVRNVELQHVKSSSSPRVMFVTSFPGSIIDDIRFTDCEFRGVETAEVLQLPGAVTFRNVLIEPAKKARSINSRPSWP